ncbi:hypothetical protein LINGRAHAP2_LOCUS34573, partial [Linum grandiflorum]
MILQLICGRIRDSFPVGFTSGINPLSWDLVVSMSSTMLFKSVVE